MNVKHVNYLKTFNRITYRNNKWKSIKAIKSITMTDASNISELEIRICLLPEDMGDLEDPRTALLRRVSYGIIMPVICSLGIIGNIFNLIVLTRRNMRGTAYIYMIGN